MAKDVGKGTTIGIDLAGGSSFTTVAQILSATPPSMEVGDVDVTTLDSTITEKIPDELPEIGDLQLEISWDPDLTSHQQFKANIALRGVTFQVTFPGNTGTNKETVTGYFKAFRPGPITPKGQLTATVIATPTTTPTWVD